MPTNTLWLRMASLRAAGQGVSVGLDGRLDIEGDERSQQRLDLGGCELGNMSREDERDARAGGIALLVHQRGVHVRVAHRRAGADLDVAQEAMLGVGASVEIEDDAGFVDLDVGDDDARAGLGGEPFADHHVEIADAGRLKFAVGLEGEPLVAAGKRAIGESLVGLQVALQENPRLGIELGLGQVHMGGRDLRKLAIDLAGSRYGAFAAAGIDGDGLGGDDWSAGSCGHEQRGTYASGRGTEQISAWGAERGRAEFTGSADGENLGGEKRRFMGASHGCDERLIGKR